MEEEGVSVDAPVPSLAPTVDAEGAVSAAGEINPVKEDSDGFNEVASPAKKPRSDPPAFSPVAASPNSRSPAGSPTYANDYERYESMLTYITGLSKGSRC